VVIPSSVSTIGLNVFGGCANLIAFNVDSDNAAYSSVGGVLFNKNQTVLVEFPSGKSGSYPIPIGVTEIGAEAFVGCTKLNSITVPKSVASIGAFAFEICTALTNIYFEGNFPSCDITTFDDVNSLTLYVLPGATWTTTLPKVLWLPQISSSSWSGPQTNQFGFNIDWARNQKVVVEASTNLTELAWTPVATNTLTSGSSVFSDDQSTNYPGRFFRVRSP